MILHCCLVGRFMKRRSGAILVELQALNLSGLQLGHFYVIGLFEGFFKQLSGSNKKIITVQIDKNREYSYMK